MGGGADVRRAFEVGVSSAVGVSPICPIKSKGSDEK